MDPKPKRQRRTKKAAPKEEAAAAPKEGQGLSDIPPQFAMVLSKRRSLHEDFIKTIKEEYGPEKGGFTVISYKDIDTAKPGQSYLVDQFIDEFGTLLRTRCACVARKPLSVVLYVLDTADDKWNMSKAESSMFTYTLMNQPEVYPTMKSFVHSLR